MSRSPLFRSIRRCLACAELSRRTGIPPSELLFRRREALALARAAADPAPPAWSRRRFLGASAGALAATALGGSALGGCVRATTGTAAGRAAGRGQDPVLIVGAGIAGLTAAYRLHGRGVSVRVFEAQNRVGGRMFSLRDRFPDGQVVELGGELINTDHHAIRGLAAELEIALDDLSIEGEGIETEVLYFGGQRRSEEELVAALQPLAGRLAADLRTIGDDEVTYASAAPGTPATVLDRMNLGEWLDGTGLSGWPRQVLDVAYTTEFGLEPEDQSALNLITLLQTDPFLIFGEGDERFRVHEGNDRIPLTLAERLGERIELGTELEAVSMTADGRVRLSLRRGEAALEAASPHVVLALPFTLLRRVGIDVPLPARKIRAIRELGYGTNAKLMIGFERRIWRERYASNGSTLSDLRYQVTWETSRHQEGRAGVLTNFTGGRHGAGLGSGTAESRAERTVEGLEHVFPGISGLRSGMPVARFHWPTHRWTLGSYASYRPGQWTAIRGAEGERVGGLHFAGEHTSRDAQGFMEGGCESGERVAAEVLRDRGALGEARSRPGGSRGRPVQRRAVLGLTTSA